LSLSDPDSGAIGATRVIGFASFLGFAMLFMPLLQAH
jgi:hypothetical protein